MFVVLTVLQIYKKVAEITSSISREPHKQKKKVQDHIVLNLKEAELAAFMQGLALSFTLIFLEVVLFSEFLLALGCLRSEVSLPARTEIDVPAPKAS
jgi:hypothetical protein